MSRRPDHDVPEVLRPKLVTLEIWLIELDGLRLGNVVHGPGRVSEVPGYVMDILDDTDDLIGPGIPHRSGTEMLADGIPDPKKPPGKGFVDDSHVPRIRVVVLVDGSAGQHSGADGIEEAGRYAGPVGRYIILRAGLWFALNPNLVAPLGAGHRGVGRGTDA